MKRIAIGLGIFTVLVLAAPTWAEFCEKCKGRMYTTDIGKCVECGGFTSSGAFKLCKKCSARLGQCEHCRAPLKAAEQDATTKPAPTTQPAGKADRPHPEIWRKYPHLNKTLNAGLGQMKIYLASLEPEAFAAKHPELARMAQSDDHMQRARAIKAISALRDMSALPIVVAAMEKSNLDAKLPQSTRRANLQPLLSLSDWIYDTYHPDRKIPRELAPLLPLFVKMLVEADDESIVHSYCFKVIGCLAGPEWLPLVRDLSASRHPAVTHWSGWALKEIARRAPIATQPASTPDYLRPLELDESHNGKTVSAFVGQQIIICLKGNPTTGYEWVVGKIEGDALGQVGKVKYVSDQPPMPAGGRGRGGGIMIHRVGVGGKYVFTFRATKAGTAKLMLEYKRGWEKDKPPAETFTLTVDTKPDPTAERVKELKANLDKFVMTISYQGRGPVRGAPHWCRHITLSVPPAFVPRTPSWQVRQISKEQAEKIIDRLAKSGFLARAVPQADSPAPEGHSYVLIVHLQEGKGRKPRWLLITENLGWGPHLLKRLEGMDLQKVLDGDAAKAVDFLLEPIREKFGKEWEKEKPLMKS